MLFNSLNFIVLFLPVVWGVYLYLRSWLGNRSALIWLVVASLYYYGYWNPEYLVLICGSILANYWIGRVLLGFDGTPWLRNGVLTVGILLNLVLLGYYKYANFIVDNLRLLMGTPWMELAPIVLPIGLSFFTFQQIAYLVDLHRREVVGEGVLDYALFVTFFPQLIAGPIVHHREMMPQFIRSRFPEVWNNLAVGVTLFVIGLAKKVLIADTIAQTSTPLFDAVANGYSPGLIEAWTGAISYGFQIYFDFSGYSDMALGLGRMFGIQLPVNFDSPYKAESITDFWRRWHITLSRFLRDYLYIPLGGNRQGVLRRQMNLMITMALGGMWHGVGWTFLLWGVLHGTFLMIHQLGRLWWPQTRNRGGLERWAGRILTYLCVTIAWVPFRAANFEVVVSFYQGMFGFRGISLPSGMAPVLERVQELADFLGITAQGTGMVNATTLMFSLPLLFVVVWALPNSQQWLWDYHPGMTTPGYPEIRGVSDRWFGWRPAVRFAIPLAVVFSYCIVKLNDISEFIYFQF